MKPFTRGACWTSYRTASIERKSVWLALTSSQDCLYSPQEVASVLSVSYDTATRIMGGMARVANFAKPRAKKRLLRIKGIDLRAYIQHKLER